HAVAPTACAAASESNVAGSRSSGSQTAGPVRPLSTRNAYSLPAERSPRRSGTNLKMAPDSPGAPAFFRPRDSETKSLVRARTDSGTCNHLTALGEVLVDEAALDRGIVRITLALHDALLGHQHRAPRRPDQPIERLPVRALDEQLVLA